MRIYVSIFTKTAASLGLAALIAAQGYDWTTDGRMSSAAVLGWGLLGAAIGGLLAVAWAFVSSPALTPAGRALRSAVQALVSSPLAALAFKSMSDVEAAADLVVPTAIYAVLAFAVSYFGNYGQVPITTARATGSDFLGT